MWSGLKIYQKFLKFVLRGWPALLPCAHRKIVLGGTTARRSYRLRRAVFFPFSVVFLSGAPRFSHGFC
jgi:hypothetical protein